MHAEKHYLTAAGPVFQESCVNLQRGHALASASTRLGQPRAFRAEPVELGLLAADFLAALRDLHQRLAQLGVDFPGRDIGAEHKCSSLETQGRRGEHCGDSQHRGSRREQVHVHRTDIGRPGSPLERPSADQDGRAPAETFVVTVADA